MFKGQTIEGILSHSPWEGEQYYNLLVDSYHWGRHRLYNSSWVFDPTSYTGDLVTLADYFGDTVVAWYQKRQRI